MMPPLMIRRIVVCVLKSRIRCVVKFVCSAKMRAGKHEHIIVVRIVMEINSANLSNYLPETALKF